MSVDLPAPFSPMMPWMVPGLTRMEMSLFACTGPKALEMPRSSIAGAAESGRPARVSFASMPSLRK
jgi:hypothetical protein